MSISYTTVLQQVVMTSTMSFEFAIYKEAHWEIIVVFTAGAPLFEDGK